MRKVNLQLLFTSLLLCCGLVLMAGGEPANDLPCNAIPVTCDDVVAGTTLGATVSTTLFCGTSHSAAGVWYSFEGNGNPATFSTCNDADYDTKISAWTGDCSGTLSCVGGNDDGPGCASFSSELTIATTAGTTYLIYVHGFLSETGNFNLTVTGTCSNDDCESAILIECGSSTAGSTIGATFDDVGTCVTSNTGPGVWYSFVGIEGSATLSTCNAANYDTKITVFAGALTCAGEVGLSCVSGNDDGPGCAGFSSEVTFATSAGTEYLVLVHGFGFATGDFVLSLTCDEATAENDACTGAAPIVCGETIAGTTTGALLDGAPFCGTSNTAPGVWYSYTAASSGTVTITTCSPNTAYDTKLGVFSGGCEGITCFDGNDDDFDCPSSIFHSTVTLCAIEGEEYLILVHGFGSGSGDFELTLTCEAGVTNDAPCSAIGLDIGVITDISNNCATADAGEVTPGAGTGTSSCDSQDGWCSFETEVQGSVWFTFVAPASGAASVEALSGPDWQVAVYAAEACFDYSSYTEIGGNDDGGAGLLPRVEAYCLNPGETYYVQIDGFAGAAGEGTIIVEDLGGEPLSCDAGGCQTKFIGYAPEEGLNHLIVDISGGAPPYDIQWSGDGIVTNSTSNHISVDPTVPTTYTVDITDANGCSTSCSVVVNVVDVTCGRNGHKIAICHNPGEDDASSLCIGYNAVRPHLNNHGDHLGFCGNECLATNPPPPPAPECFPLIVSITTDRFASETSWSLTQDGIEIASGEQGSLFNELTQEVYNDCEIEACYELTIFDSFGDGICCSFGLGDYSMSFDGVVVSSPTGGAFGVSETISIGCDGGRLPDIINSQARKLGESKVSVFPNPMSSSARMLVVPAEDAKTVIDILNINGQVISNLYSGQARQGQVIDQQISGDIFQGSGIYLYRVTIGDETFVDKIIYNR